MKNSVMKRFLIIVLLSIIFVFTMFSSIVTTVNIVNYESIDFSAELEPTNTLMFKERYNYETMWISQAVLEDSEYEYYSSLYWKVIDNQTNDLINQHPNYETEIETQDLKSVYTLNLETGEEIHSDQYRRTHGALENPIDQSLIIGWDTDSDAYKQAYQSYEIFESFKDYKWGLFGWPILIILWIFLLITHYQDSKESFITKIPTELIFLAGISLVTMILIVLTNQPLYVDLYSPTPYQIMFGITLIIVSTLMVAIVSTLFVMAFLSKIKTKTFIKNSFVGIGFNWIQKFLGLIPNNLKFILFSAGFVLLHFIVVFGFSFQYPLLFLLLLAFDVLLFTRVMEANNQRLSIQKHLSLLREGEINEPLNKAHFLEFFHQPIDDVNNLQEGLQAAVEKSLIDERMSIDLITNVSHDLKTPLTTIINYTDFLIDNVNPERHEEYLHIIKEKSLRLSELVSGVVEASKASSGKMDVELVDLNALELLNQVLVDHQDQFMKKNLVLLVDEKSIDFSVSADSQKLHRVFENLFKNIEKYATDDSRVYIQGANELDQLIISFKNISKYALGSEDLTARFVQGDVSRQTEGSGLGLAISKDLMKLMNGDLQIEVDGDLFKVKLTLNKTKI